MYFKDFSRLFDSGFDKSSWVSFPLIGVISCLSLSLKARLGSWNVFCAFQAHYAVQARRSRSVTRKRKREDSVPPTSIARSRSCSRTPRDVSGLRDTKVSLCHVQLVTGWPLLLATQARRAKPPSPAVIWSRGCRWGLAVCCTPRAAPGPVQLLDVPGSVPWLHHSLVVSSQGKQKHGVTWRWA